MIMTNDEVAELVSQSQSGNREAFGRLVERYAGQVTAVAYVVLGDFGKSEDVGQDAFLEVWGKLGQLKDASKFVPWVCTIVRRRAIDLMRKRSEAPVSAAGDYAIDQADSAEDAFSDQKEREMMWNMVESLPETYRETLVLYYRSEQSVEEVAKALEATPATIRQRLKRGRDLLRDEAVSRLAGQLKASAPTAAFTAAILACIGKGTTAAAATGAAGLAGGAALKSGLAATSGTVTKAGAGATGLAGLGAIAGPAIGLAGGGLGAWSSWKNASYQSQRQFIVRQTIVYLLAAGGFAGLGGLLYFVTYSDIAEGWISKSFAVACWVVLLVLFQVWNGIWMIRVIRRDRWIVDEAVRTNEPLLPGAKPLRAHEEPASTKAANGAITASGWFGGIIGGSLWMLIATIILFLHQSAVSAAVVVAAFTSCNVAGVLVWQKRDFRGQTGGKSLCSILGVCTSIAFLAIEFLATPAAKANLQWSPPVWLVLLIFPVLYWRFAWADPHSSQE